MAICTKILALAIRWSPGLVLVSIAGIAVGFFVDRHLQATLSMDGPQSFLGDPISHDAAMALGFVALMGKVAFPVLIAASLVLMVIRRSALRPGR